MKPERLVSLDAFRGFTIAGMILVNNPGSWSYIYPQLEHASWSGWTFTDFIFPFFLWIVGVSMTFSFAVRKSKGDDNTKLLLGVLRRSAIMFGLGIFLAGFPFGMLWGHHFEWATIRIPGVLQRIAVCYLISSIIYLNTSMRGVIAAIGALFVTYWLFMVYYPVPEIGAGLFEKGRNFAAYIDSMFLTGHMWGATKTWDPEGLFSTLPAIASSLFGAITGDYLRQSPQDKTEKSVWMFVFGSGFLLLGAILDMWMPINKSLWTVSYTIFMAGWALCIFGIFYFLIDAKGIKKWAYPLIVYGMNAIFVFVLSGVAGRAMGLWKFNVLLSDGTFKDVSIKTIITQNLFEPFFSPLNASLMHAIVWISVMYLVVWVMYKRKWFVKI
ncbi:MAG: acyltransferase family protein [Bacteroidota bacterium]